MASIRPFRAIRPIAKRLPAFVGALEAQTRVAESRTLRHLLENPRARGLLLAEWRRAGILVRDAVPTVTILRRGAAIGLYAVAALTSSSNREREEGVALMPAVCTYEDPRRRIHGRLLAETEREPDVSFPDDHARCEVWIVDDEDALNRLCTLLDGAEVTPVAGAEHLTTQVAPTSDVAPRAADFGLCFLHSADEEIRAVPGVVLATRLGPL